jgi:ABC-2 type transport system permease protein
MTSAASTPAPGVFAAPHDAANLLSRARACAWIIKANARRRDVLASAAVMSMFVVIVVGALGSMWHATVGSHRSIAGYTPDELVWYIAIAEACVVSVATKLLVDLGDSIRDGDVAVLLLRPLSLPAMLVSEEWGRALARMACVWPTACIVAFALAGAPGSWAGLASCVVLMPLAALLNIIVTVWLAASTFWLGDSRAAWFLQQKVIFLVGGMLLPLEFWPAGADTVLRLLPPAAMAYWPARAMTTGDPADMAMGLGLELGWIIVAAAAAQATFRRGERRIVVAGG